MIGGDQLMRLGVEQGPLYRELLDAILAAKLDGRVSNLEDEIELVKQLVG